MRRLALLVPVAAILFLPVAAASRQANTAERLGYPRDSKLLIIHADDVGLAHSVNRASFEALERGDVTSGSVMVPCPWFSEVADYARQHPGADIGIHLTLTSEWQHYRWGSVGRGAEPGLLDPSGYLWPDSPPVAKAATPEEVERELRAQIDRAMAAGMHPTHVDSHMGATFVGGFFPVYVKLAREYRIPFFMLSLENIPPPFRKQLGDPGQLTNALRPDDIYPDTMLSAHPGVPAAKWLDFYVDLVRNLKPGLTQLIVHVGYDDAELSAITGDRPFGSAWRQRDLEVLRSAEFKKALGDNHVRLVGWKEIGKALASSPRP